MTAAISFENVSKTFTTSKGKTFTALDDVTLEIAKGDVYGLVGYSGAGKSTLLRTVNALERPTGGRVVVSGQDISRLHGPQLYRARQRIGMVFQQFNLLRSRTVFKNIAYPLKLAGLSEGEIVDRAEELLEFVGLTDRALYYPSQLSGGQKQRVGIARALATRPEVLISDEATSALDPQTTGEVLDLLSRVNAEYGVTILLVTHEMDVIRTVANKVAVMQNGRVIEAGSVYDIFSRPEQPTTKRFVASVMHHIPDEATLGRIRAAHRGRLVSVHVENAESSQPLLSRLARDHNVDFNVVFGGVSELQGRLFGNLTVELVGAEGDIDSAIAAVAAKTPVKEVTGRG